MSFMSEEPDSRGETESHSHTLGGPSVSCCPQPCSWRPRGRAASLLAGWGFNLGILHS